MRHIAVIGGSLAGMRAVEALRDRGFDGRITWVGAEKHRPYDRPPLSKQMLRGEWTAERVALTPRKGYDALQTDTRFGVRAVSLDARDRVVTLDDGSRLSFDGLVIATGATPRRLRDTEGLAGVHVLRTLDDALAIRRALEGSPRVVIVGAGFIGLEVAASCRALGLDVTVLEMAPVPLSAALGTEIGASIAELHVARGVTVRTGVSVDGLTGGARVDGVRLGDGSSVPADLVVVGIGVAPETGWLEGSGVELNDGVVCDACCRTNVPGIVACGDVARWPNPLFSESMRVEHWTNAVEQSRAAVTSLLDGDGAERFAPVPYFWSDQYDLKFQFAGRTSGADSLEILEGGVQTKDLVAVYRKARRLIGVLVVNKPAALIRHRKSIAAGG